MGDYFLFYTESMIVCIVIFSVLLGYDLIRGNRQERQIKYDNVLIAHICYFINDGVWAAILSGKIRATVFSVLLVNYMNFFLLIMIAFCWFVFAAAMEDMPGRNSRRGRMVFCIPLFAGSAGMLISFIAAPGLWVDESLRMTPLYNIFFVLTPVVYLIAALVYSLHQAGKKENMLNRRLYLLIGFYPLTVVVAGLVQTNAVNAPIFCYSCTVMMLIFFITMLSDQISMDPLTKLNNRGQLMRFVSQETSLHKDDIRTFVVMADVNGFKGINDNYGHAEGDRALRLIADTLRETAVTEETPPFLGRYGGDEFVLIVYSESEEAVRRFLDQIRRSLKANCERKSLPYVVSLGFGFDEYRPEDSFQNCIERADQKLYLDKRSVR